MLKATHFDLNFALEELRLYQVVGSLHTLAQEKIHLKSDCIDFKHQESTVFLKGASFIEFPPLGCLSSSEEMKLFLENHLTADLYTTGVTTLKSITGDHITSYGPIHVDSLTHTITAHPSSCHTPLLYEGEELLLEAQEAILTYEEGGKLFSPHQLELEGAIKILSKEALSHQIQAVADHVSYHPSTKNCILKAHTGSKVLITQESPSLKMSADEIHLIYDPFAKEYSIQGVGCVSFSLSATEQQLLNQVFHDKKHAS
ncbi:hypothetical protein [Rhabdochlamydiaceae symbiont of Dictyostelium giganteum]|uniref:hypothetical protein n=1 Tax=Rhabdochlamydiaceae symbiont of Dictyostelium giganteum TaxID=3342349 RepID=UPI00384DEE07